MCIRDSSTSIGAVIGVTPKTDATPRRLVIRAEALQEREPDSEERVWGPAKSAPAPAIAGFAKKQGLAPEDLEIVSDGKTEKYSCIRRTKGRTTLDILADALPALILKTPFPKTMYLSLIHISSISTSSPPKSPTASNASPSFSRASKASSISSGPKA